MLEALRNATGGWFAKIFIALLVASFAVWGIADIFTGGQGRSLATVGKTEISPYEFQRVFRVEQRALSQRLGRAINQEQARALGLDRQVLNRLIGQAALNSHVIDLGLRLSDKSIAESIANNASFKDSSGNFSRSQFQAVLFQSGITEQAYVASQRNSLLRSQIGRIIETGIKPPEFLLKTLFNFQAEKRQVNYFKVPASAVGSIADPSNAELSGFYDQHKPEFRAPEYRTISVLSVQPLDVAETVEVTVDDLKQAYSDRSDQYERQEKREVLQIVFPTKEQAEEARTNLTTFEDYKALAKKRGMKDSDLNLGLIEKSALIDPKFADVAFSLAENKISDPIQGVLSTALLFVKRVEKGGMIPFDDIKEKLKSTLALERAQEEILNLHDTIEDERAGGSTLAEVGKKVSIKTLLVDMIDRAGNDENGIKVDGLPASPGLLSQVFGAAVGDEIAPIETTAGGFIWVNIEKVIPTADRPLERAKADVITLWKQAEAQKKLKTFSDELIERLKNGDGFLKVASSVGSKVKVSKELTRFDNEDDISTAAVTRIFLSSLDEISSSIAAIGDARIIFKLTKIDAPGFDSATVDVKALEKHLTTAMSIDLMTGYETALRENTTIEINQRVWSEVTGGANTSVPLSTM